METNNLVEIVRRAQNGDSYAQQALYLDSSKSVYFLALKILKNPDDAEDIMQDVFITIFDKLPTLKEPAAYYKWINQITANKCMSFLRKKRPALYEDQDILDALVLEEDDDTPTPEKLYDDEETRRLMIDIIDTLPDAQRVCVMYRYFSQFSIEEIAAITKTNEHTVKSRLALARQKIRAAILEKEKKEDIRLHGIIPIMPVLMKSLEDFQMPEGLTERMWEKIAEGAGNAAGNTATVSESAGPDAGASSQIGPKLGNGMVSTAAKRTIPLAAKVIAGVVAGILVTGGIIAANLPKQPSEADIPPVASTVAASIQPSEQPSVQPSELPSAQPSEPLAQPSESESPTPSVEDYAQYYASVIENYRAFVMNETFNGDTEQPWANMDEALDYAENPVTDFGYALQDLNGNGIPELILLSKSVPDICAIYSLVDNTPHLLDGFWTRYLCDIGADGTLYIHGSGGFADSSDAAHTIAQDGKSLILIEEIGIESYDHEAGQSLDVPRYYRVDANGVKTIISEDEAIAAQQRFNEARANKWNLPFTPLW